MNKGLCWLLSVTMLLGALGSVLPRPMRAAPVAPTETGVYVEDFSTYTHLEYADKSEWDVFAESLHLRPVDAVAHKWMDMVYDGIGSLYVIWEDYRNGDPDIYMQRTDLDGNPLWENDLRVNVDIGDMEQHHPALDLAPDGSVVVAWVNERSVQSQVYDVLAQRINADGIRMWSNECVVNVGGVNYRGIRASLDLATDTDGNAFVTWLTPERSPVVQRVTSDCASKWTNDVIASVSGDYDGVALDVGPDDQAVFAWSGPPVQIHKVDALGNLVWTEAISLTVPGSWNGEYGSQPAVAVTSNNDIYVAWRKNLYYDIYAQKLSSTGQFLWGQPVLLAAQNHTQPGDRVEIALDDAGGAIVVWDGYDGYPNITGMWAQRVDSEGVVYWGEPVELGDQSLHPTVAAGLDGQVFVGVDGVALNPFSITQGIPAHPVYTQVSNATGRSDQWEPALQMTSDESLMLGWHEAYVASDQGGHNVRLAKLSRVGTHLWPYPVRVNWVEGSVNYAGYHSIQSTPIQMVVGLDDKSSVAWYNTQNNVVMQQVDMQGNKLWPADAAVDDHRSHFIEGLDTMPDGSTMLAYWGSEYITDTWVDSTYIQRVSPEGVQLWSEPLRLYEKGLPSEVSVVATTSSTIYIGDSSYIWRLNADGVIIWQSEPIYGPIALYPTGELFTYWRENNAVYAQKLNPDGIAVWPTDKQVSVSSYSFQYSDGAPTVAVGTDGVVVLVWEYAHTLYTQRVLSDGTPIWTEDLALFDIDKYVIQYDPTVTLDSDGTAYVVWTDFRYGNRDLFMQCISPTGVRVWASDVPIIESDFSYFPSGLAQSRSVDTTEDFITSATLTAQYVLQGGLVTFYLSNDGGNHWAEATLGVTHNFTTSGSDLRWRVEITSDPTWRNRSPIIEQLRIEYETTSAGGDDYEPDDACAQAQPLAVNGATQAHTFHQQADEDWAWFDVISGTTYIVQTSNTQANADTELELRAACPQLPFAGDDNVFGQDARVTWQASFSGTVYVKVTHHDPAVYGADTGYDLSVRTFTQPPVAVIVAGHDNSYTLQSNIDAMADMAYRTFLNSGVPKTNIRYFGPNLARDVDGNGLNDDLYATVTITGVREAVQDWSREQGVQLGVSFYVYLVDHGHYDQFLAAGSTNKIWAADLNLWLSNLEATSGADNINVILEACKSGSFIDMTTLGPAQISGHNRVVIASTSSTLNAYPSPQGGYFSDVFWTAVGQNQDLKTAFEWAKQAVQATELSQQPWLDDNGDAVADAQDGALARGRGLGGAFAGSPPVIDWVQAEEVDGQATIQAQARDDFGVGLVWAEVYAPDFVEPEPSQDGTTPLVNVPTTTLTLVGSDLYGATYLLTQTGSYRLVVYALDDDGNRALPQVARLCVGCTYVYLPLVLRGE